jgi:hypothetical protein
MNLRKAIAFILAAAVSVVGCDDDDDEVVFPYGYYYDDYAYTTWYWDDWTMDPVFAMTDPFETPYYADVTFLSTSHEAPHGEPEVAAEIVADNMEQYFTPAGCARIDRSGSEITVTLARCRGPFMIGSVDGALRAAFSDEDGQIAFAVTTEDLVIDGIRAELDASGVYSATDGTKTVRYTARGSLNGERPLAGEFDSVVTWTAGTKCITRNTTGQVTAQEGTIDVDIAGYARCVGECPTAGVITVSDPMGMARLTFDGSNQARLDRADGQSEELVLACD